MQKASNAKWLCLWHLASKGTAWSCSSIMCQFRRKAASVRFLQNPFGSGGWGRPNFHHLPSEGRKHGIAPLSFAQWIFALFCPISGSYDSENSLLEIISEICFTSKILETEISFPGGGYFISSKLIYISNSRCFPVFQAHIFELETWDWKYYRRLGLSHDHFSWMRPKFKRVSFFLPLPGFPISFIDMAFVSVT